MMKMTLQQEFFEYFQQDVGQYHSGWNRRPTKQWYNCSAQIDGRKRVILWVKKPNSNGTFQVYVSIPQSRIFNLPNIILKQDMSDNRKVHISLRNIPMTPIELLDRGLSETNPWGKKWPVGFKIIDRTQFELAKRIIIKQWTCVG